MLGARGDTTEAYFERYVEGGTTRATMQMSLFQQPAVTFFVTCLKDLQGSS